MMQRRHYEMIAKVLDDLDGHEIGLSRGTHRDIAAAFAATLAADNPRFDRARFMRAAGAMEEEADAPS